MQNKVLFTRCEAREPLKEQNLGLPRNGEASKAIGRYSGEFVPKRCPDAGGVEAMER